MTWAYQSFLHSQRHFVFQSVQSPISFAEFWQTVADQSCFLKKQQQQHYALWTEDSYHFLTWLWAAIIANKTVILPPHRMPQLQRDYLEQGIVFLDDQLQVTKQSLTIDKVVDDWDDLIVRSQLIFFTSGSTGRPKQILRTMQQLLSEVTTLQATLSLQTPYTMVASVSHQHIYGMLFKVLFPLMSGQSMFREQIVYPEHIEATLARLHAQGQQPYLITSPALLKRCTASFDFAMSSMIFSSGGKLESGIRTYYPQTLIEIFGSSETGGIASRSQDDATWQVMPDVEVKIDAEQQLWIKTAHAYQSDWIATGDLAQMQKDGFILLGRSDRIVKLEEKRISLDAIEHSIQALPAVEQAYTLIHTHNKRELLAAVVVLSETVKQELLSHGKKAIVSRLRQQLQDQLEPIAMPHLWRFVSAIPCNAQGKIDKASMQALFEELKYPLILNKTVIHDDATDQINLQLEFLPELLCFKGHFPQYPVYPGVGQIAFLIKFAQDLWSDLLFCTGYEQLKFQDIIRSHDVLTLQMNRQVHKVVFTLEHQDGRRMASGRLTFAIDEGT